MAVYVNGQIAASVLLGLFLLIVQIRSDTSCDIDVENTLKNILTPQETTSIQVQAIRSDLLRKLQDVLEREALDREEESNYKRSIASLVAWNNLPEHKRNLEALARAGYIKTLPLEEEDDANYKRSIANLAKNGQLPMRDDDQKRGIQALARNGDLHPRKEIQELLDDLYGKRNIGSLARSFNLPDGGKRSLSSLARSGDLNYQKLQYKRNIASIVREGKFTGKREAQTDYTTTDRQEKRNLPSIKAQYKPKFKRSTSTSNERSKRQADYFFENGDYPASALQNTYDYDNLIQDFNAPVYGTADKRFLGSVAKTGWFQPSSSSSGYSRFVSPEKRHIGSLARLGWLPAFRNVRRFNRSGRSTISECREAASDGKTEVNSSSQDPSLLVDDKRYLYKPDVDNILLRHIFFHPRSH